MTSKDDTGSAPDDDKVEEDAPAVTPLEVKVTNTPTKDVKWNDDRDDMEYDEIVLTDEDKNI